MSESRNKIKKGKNWFLKNKKKLNNFSQMINYYGIGFQQKLVVFKKRNVFNLILMFLFAQCHKQYKVVTALSSFKVFKCKW